MATPCPKCGKSIRQGAKFCGFCGHVLGDPGTGQPKAAATPLEQRSVGNPCPHCGKPNRQGVKFCASCGKGLAPVDATSPSLHSPSQGPVRHSKPKRSRLVTIGFLATVVVVVCGSLFGIAWATGLLEGILPGSTLTDSEVASVDRDTLVPIATDTQTLAPTITTAAPLDTPTPTELILTFAPTLPPTETPLPTITSTPEPNILFKDDFNGDLGLWEGWSQRPLSILDGIFPAEISLGEYLELMGMDYKAVGVTSIQTVTLVSGLVIDFSAEADNYFNPSIYLDWNPGVETRKPFRIGPLFLEVNNSEVVFHYKSNEIDQECSASISGTGMKLYRIEFGPHWEVKVFMDDGELLEICSVTIDEPYDIVGKLTFSGFGLVDSIIVTEP